MIDKNTAFQTYARQILEVLSRTNDFQRIYDSLCEEPLVEKILASDKPKFSEEYSSAKLALGTIFWVTSCEENEIAEELIQKLFLKSVLARFESPQAAEEAVVFSEYLYSQDLESESAPIIAVVQHLFKRLGLESITRAPDGTLEISAAFHKMVGVFEAFKISFQNAFFEFVTSDLAKN